MILANVVDVVLQMRDSGFDVGEISFRFNWRKSVKSAYLATKNIM